MDCTLLARIGNSGANDGDEGGGGAIFLEYEAAAPMMKVNMNQDARMMQMKA